ncbi:MAG: OadG family protein [Clostridia bacterium]|nr:OadG family protein [Clostridia bacterium]
MFLPILANVANETENVWGLSLNVLVTGIVVVFAVLLLLILLIKLYSTIVYKAQNRTPKSPKGDGGNVAKSAVIDNGSAMALTQPQGLTDELIAVITAAAVTAMGTSNIRVTGIRKRTSRSEWSNAGINESVKPFRMGDWK